MTTVETTEVDEVLEHPVADTEDLGEKINSSCVPLTNNPTKMKFICLLVAKTHQEYLLPYSTMIRQPCHPIQKHVMTNFSLERGS